MGISNFRSPWHFDTLLLSDSNLVEFLSAQIEFFISTNTTNGISAGGCLENLEGVPEVPHYILCGFPKKKQHTERLSKLTFHLAELDAKYAASPSPGLYKQILKLRLDFDVLSMKQAEDML